MILPYVGLGIILLGISWVAFLIFRGVFNDLRDVVRAHKLGRPSLRKSAKLIGAILLIGLCEYSIPTFGSANVGKPTRIEPDQRVLDRAWTRQELTYDDVSKIAPWLAPLGYMSKDAFTDRLLKYRRDSVAYLVKLRAKQHPTGSSKTREMIDISRIEITESVLEGIDATLKNIDALYVDGDVSYFQAASYLIAEQQKNNRASLESARSVYIKAERARDAFKLRNPENRPFADDPDYVKLENAVKGALYIRDAFYSRTSRLYELDLEIARKAKAMAPDARFPTLVGPITVFDDQYIAKAIRSIVRKEYPLKHTGPKPIQTLKSQAKRLYDAVSGYQRTPRPGTDRQWCYVLIADSDVALKMSPKAQRFCEAAFILPINYDVTAQNCRDVSKSKDSPFRIQGDSDPVSTACIEHWISPYLNVVYDTDQITVYEPRPHGISLEHWQRIGSPISTWSVSYKGEEKPLRGQVSFPWDGSDDVLSKIAITHKPRTRANTPRIWQDFRIASFGAPIEQAIGAPALSDHHHFSAVTIDTIQGSLEDLYAGRFRIPVVRSSSVNLGIKRLSWMIQKRRVEMINFFADSKRVNKTDLSCAKYRRPQLEFATWLLTQKQVEKDVNLRNATNCETVYAIDAIFEPFEDITISIEEKSVFWFH